jgi:molybdopterin synthase catalytic subunit
MVTLTGDPLDVNAVLASVRDESCGAVVCFLGVVRADEEGGDRVAGLEYEAHGEMAVRAMDRIGEEMGRCVRWAIAHRTGRLRVGEISVVVAVAAPHRAEAFEACRFAVERLKKTVPIWKKMHFSSGRTAWAEGFPLE